MVYDSQWALVHSIRQDSTASNFGVIADEFTPGTYHLVFIGTQYDVKGPNQDFYTDSPRFQDDFFTKNITITVTNTNISQDVVLERVAAKLQLIFQDTIPSDLASFYSLEIKYQEHLTYLYSVGVSGPPGIATANLNLREFAGKPNYTFTTLVYNTIAPATIILIPHSTNSPERYTPDTIKNVIFKKNQVTILRGKVFRKNTPVSNAGFQVTLNPNWGPSVVFPF